MNLNQATRHFCWGAWTAWHKTVDQEYMHIFDLFCQVGSTRWISWSYYDGLQNFTLDLSELHKGYIYTVENVGGGIGHNAATEVTHLGLNEPPVLSSVLKG